jgi:hypothetical protein
MDLAPANGNSWIGSELDGTKVALVKLDKSRTVLWSKVIEGITSPSVSSVTYSDMEVDSEGNIYLTGRYSGIIDYDPGAAQVLSTQSTKTWFLLKLDGQGEYVWVKEFAPANSNANSISLFIPALEIDEANNLYLGGSFGGILNFDPSGVAQADTSSSWGGYTHDCFVSKYTSDGDFVWRNIFGGHRTEHFFQMKFTETNQLVVAGDFQDSIHFDVNGQDVFFETGPFASNHLFLSAMDSDGSMSWAKQIYSNQASVKSIVTTTTGEFFIGGNFSASINFTPPFTWTYIPTLDYTVNQEMTTDCFLAKYTTQGDVSDVHTFGGIGVDEFNAAVSTQNGELIIGAWLNHDSVYFDNQIVSLPYDPFILFRTDVDGYLKHMTLLDTGSVIYSDLHIDAEENFFAAGYFYSGADFNPQPGIQTIVEPIGSDLFIFRWDNFITPEMPTEPMNWIYPNPAMDDFTVYYPGESEAGFLIELIGLNGELIKSISTLDNSHVIHLNDVHAGMYFVKISHQNFKHVEKLIVVH